jgi:hypothetical protein
MVKKGKNTGCESRVSYTRSKASPRMIHAESVWRSPTSAPVGGSTRKDPGVRHGLSSWSCRVPKQFPCQLKPSIILPTRSQSRSFRLLYVSVITSDSPLHLVSARITVPFPCYPSSTTRRGHVESVLLSVNNGRAVTLAIILSTSIYTGPTYITSSLSALPRLNLSDAVLPALFFSFAIIDIPYKSYSPADSSGSPQFPSPCSAEAFFARLPAR